MNRLNKFNTAFLLIFIGLGLYSQGIFGQSFHLNDLKIIPIEHASLVIKSNEQTLLIDPVGDPELYAAYTPDLILITDVHQDHLNLNTLGAIVRENTTLLVPLEVKNKLFPPLSNRVKVIQNGQDMSVNGMGIKAIPMYNLREEAKNFHTKGRGNGYVISLASSRIYISGDTEDIPEMRALKNIDIALVCMNLPYTMTVDNAADAVMEFKPKHVIPYHYRGRPKVSDVARFKSLITNPKISVHLLDWYPKEEY